MSGDATLTDGEVVLRIRGGSTTSPQASWSVHVGADEVGPVGLSRDAGVGALTWSLEPAARGRGYATRAVRALVDFALTETGQGGLGLERTEALVPVDDEPALRVATRSGLRQEGVRRVVPGADGVEAYAVLARLATDPPLSSPGAFRTLLNSFLPRKRAIAQMLLRDPAGRVLMCRLTYKQDHDLPGGVVEVGESPRLAVARELTEELGLVVEPGRLLLTDWLPAWSGWDDALCLVFDGGVHDAALVDRVVLQEREIRGVAFCTPAEVAQHATDFTARRVSAALAALASGAAGYAESGRV